MELVTSLEAIRHLAAQRNDEFQVMYYMLDRMEHISDKELDALVEAIAAPIIAAIDCQQCANCCRTLDVYLTPADAQRIADGIDIPLADIIINHVDQDSARKFGEWGKFRVSPCSFLEGTRCSIYEHRPETCRSYPALTPDFRWTLLDTIDGAGICPIIYNVLDEMTRAIDRLSRRDPL